MRKKIVLLSWLFTIIPAIGVLAQCDTAFYNFKRDIISVASTGVDTLNLFSVSKEDLLFEFSDYRKYKYTISDESGIAGFWCFRNDVCNNYKDSSVIKCYSEKKRVAFFSFDKSGFEYFIASDDKKIYDLPAYRHLYSKLIEEPVEGWSELEQYYFLNKSYRDTMHSDKHQTLFLSIPVYIFKDKEMQHALLLRIEVSGVNKNNIRLMQINRAIGVM